MAQLQPGGFWVADGRNRTFRSYGRLPGNPPDPRAPFFNFFGLANSDGTAVGIMKCSFGTVYWGTVDQRTMERVDGAMRISARRHILYNKKVPVSTTETKYNEIKERLEREQHRDDCVDVIAYVDNDGNRYIRDGTGHYVMFADGRVTYKFEKFFVDAEQSEATDGQAMKGPTTAAFRGVPGEQRLNRRSATSRASRAKAISDDVQRLIASIERDEPQLGLLRLKDKVKSDITKHELHEILGALARNTSVGVVHLEDTPADDETVAKLIDVLRQKRIWGVNLGEWFKVTNRGWNQLLEAVPQTHLICMYISEPDICGVSRDQTRQFQARIRHIREHVYSAWYTDPVQRAIVTLEDKMWWNPRNSRLFQGAKSSGHQACPMEIETASVTGESSGLVTDAKGAGPNGAARLEIIEAVAVTDEEGAAAAKRVAPTKTRYFPIKDNAFKEALRARVKRMTGNEITQEIAIEDLGEDFGNLMHRVWQKKFHSEERRIWKEEIANDFTDRDNIFPFTREYRAMLGVYDIAKNEQQLWIMALILCGVTHTPVPRQMVDDATYGSATRSFIRKLRTFYTKFDFLLNVEPGRA